jgi:adenosylcobinamide kinase/adenosylcobinamide-phosphate guanylyltransferase
MGKKKSAKQKTTARVTRHPSPSRRGRLILVLGGTSSGKSATAMALAGKAGPRAFVATGQALDDEMAERIQQHQQSRDRAWRLAEVPVDVAGWLGKEGHAYRTIVLDCLTLWLSNVMGRDLSTALVPSMVTELLLAIRATGAKVVVVTNELGLGLVPADAASRRFRDAAGIVNQRMAREADEVYVTLSGIPLRIK